MSGEAKKRLDVKRCAAIGIALLLIMQLLVLCASQTLAAAGYEVYVTGSGVNVRSGAGTEYAKIGTASKGSCYDYLGEGTDSSGTVWYKIQYTPADVGWITSQYSAKAAVSADDVQSYIDSIAAQYGAVGVQVAVIENGAVTDTYCYGWATKDSDAMTSDHKIRVASISKIAVAASALKMEEQGIVDIDGSIGAYWGASPYHPVTLSSMLTHTSTLKSLSYSSTVSGTLSQLTSSSSYSSGTVGSSSVWMYNNYAAGVAGSTLELAAEQTLNSYTKTNVFEPLGMDAAFNSGSLSDTSKLATLYYPDGTVARTVSYQLTNTGKSEPGKNISSFAGGLTCSAEDLAKLMAMLINDGAYNGVQILSPASVARMEEKLFTKSEYGGTFWQCMPLRYMTDVYGEEGIYYHTGNAYGVLAMASYSPTSGNGVVVLTTGMTSSDTTPACGRDSNGIYNICSKISDHIYRYLASSDNTTTTTETTSAEVTTTTTSATATTTATTTSATTTTTTTAAPVISAESIVFDLSEIALGYGSSTQLGYTVVPADASETLVWASSDGCVTVDQSGRITAAGYGTAIITLSGENVQASCTVTVAAVDEEYDVVPNIVAGASKLYEPWGLRYFAVYSGEDKDRIADRGLVILKDIYYTDGMTGEQFAAAENAFVFTASEGELGFEEASTNYADGRYFATLEQGIYSYDISAYYYVMPYAVMENGEIIYGTIKANSMERILNTNLTLPTITDEEKAICTCILNLKDSVAAHYAAAGIPGVSYDIDIPQGDSQTAAQIIISAEEAGLTPNVVSGASRLIEPWGLRYFARYDGEGIDNIADRGMVMLSEHYYDDSYADAPDAMRLNESAYIFTESGGTLTYDEPTGRYYGTFTGGISSKDIADSYYVVPFVVLNDGSYVYGAVKHNSMLNIMNYNLNSTSVSETEKAVTQDIIALYEAVKAYYEV